MPIMRKQNCSLHVSVRGNTSRADKSANLVYVVEAETSEEEREDVKGLAVERRVEIALRLCGHRIEAAHQLTEDDVHERHRHAGADAGQGRTDHEHNIPFRRVREDA